MLFCYCRAGYEADCAAELGAIAGVAGVRGACDYRPRQAYVLWRPQAAGAERHDFQPDFDDLAFTRQLLSGCRLIDLPAGEGRLAALVEEISRPKQRYASVSLEAPDADAPRQMLAGARGLAAALEEALRSAGTLAPRQRRRLHVVLLDRERALLGTSEPDNSSPWPMGIPRLRFPAGAPSRSGLKLAEALALFIGEAELPQRMRAGRVAIDLGAAPGGWSQVLAARGLRVVAVDNGAISPNVLATQLVEHRREDAFRFRPEWPVDWMVCDVVAAPARIAALVAQWLARGWCRESIFNLKMPGNERLRELARCHDVIERTLAAVEGRHALRFKHLYHDRDEVTGHLQRL